MAELKNDKGSTEADHCDSGLGLFCSWDDIQSWSRELAKRRQRAFLWLNAYDRGAEPEVPAGLAEQLRAWALSSAVRDESKLSDQTAGLPSEEHVEQIIALIKTGDALLARVAAVDPSSGPVTQLESETARFEPRWYHWAAAAGLGYWAYRRSSRAQ